VSELNRTVSGLTDRPVLIRGLNDVASAVALELFKRRCKVAIHHDPEAPKAHRRQTMVDGGFWEVVVDARMRKRQQPMPIRGIVPLMIGLGPGHIAALTADIAIETKWGDDLGRILREGATLPLGGEPRSIEGVGRERNIYAPIAGMLDSAYTIGEPIAAGARIALIGEIPIYAPISGTLRGLTRPGIDVQRDDKIIEFDPRAPDRAGFAGLGERPQRIADGVALAIRQWTKDAQ
jgi:xanthine dehydrogenase accessory factor